MTDLPKLRDEPRLGDVIPEREKVRGHLAYGLLILFGAILAVTVTGALVRGWPQMEGLAAGIIGPLVGLVGTCLGFYFGQRLDAEK